MSKRKLKTFGKMFFVLVVLLTISAFTIKPDQAQQASLTPTPTLTATLPGGAQSSEDPQDDSSEPSATPAPDELPLEAYSAYTPTPLPEIKSYAETASFTFRNVGVDNIVLNFPSVYEMEIALPNQWNIAYPQSYLELNYDLFERNDWEGGGPLVEVYLDGYLAGIIAPESGKNKTARIDMPYLLLEDRPANYLNSYVVTFEYLIGDGDVFNEDWCDYGGVLTIHGDSSINVVFDEIGARRNLATFPRPLVQDTFIPETLYFILPDDYTGNDLAAMATTSSAIGRGSAGNLKFNVVKASDVTSEMLADANAVVIGKPDNNSFLDDLYTDGLMPTDLSFDGTSILGLSDQDDGILQLIMSPQDSKYSYLVVSGNSDRGVLRAAQALSDPPVGMAGSTFVVNADLEFPPLVTEEQEFTRYFSDLGFVDRVLYGIGTEQTVLVFFVPRDWEIQDDASLVLNYAHSEDISYSHSAMNVYINDVPIADAVIDDRTGEKQITIPLKKEHILTGTQNVIRVETVLQQPLECAPYDPRSAWMVIRDSSVLHLPYTKIAQAEDLPSIPHPFYYLVTTPEILFSLPEEPSKEELGSIAYLSFVLGGRLFDTQTGFDFLVNLDPTFDPGTEEDASMVLIGKPTENSLIAEINDSLPQPFVPGEDTLAPKQLASKYRIQDDVSIGLIQALSAPWNLYSEITVITGTTDEALKWAIDAAVDEDIYFTLDGDILFIRENIVEAFQSDAPVRASLDVVLSEITEEDVTLEEIQETNTATPQATPDLYMQAETSPQYASLGMYAIYGVIFIGIIVALVGLIRTVRGGRKR